MNATHPTNPFPRAFAALTSHNAKAYYAMRAQQDIGITITAIGYAVEVALYLADFAINAVDEFIEESIETPASIQPCFPAPVAVAALPPAKPHSIGPKFSRPIPMAGNTASGCVLVTPAPIANAAKNLIEAMGNTDKSLEAARLMKLSRDALRSACRDRKISYTGRHTKADLVEKLIENGHCLGAIQSHRIKSFNGRWVSIA